MQHSDVRYSIADTSVPLRLNDFVNNGLTHNEIRYLRDHLNTEFFQFYKDICANLPVELLLWVTKYLELEDLLRARQVSHKWNVQFSTPDFCIGVIKHRFRSTWENDYNRSLEDPEHIEIQKERLKAWLPRAIKHRLRWGKDRYYDIAQFGYSEAISRHARHLHQYRNGRVAFSTYLGITVIPLNVCTIFSKFLS